ncbi:MAG: sigma-70 family RNA polymerase sigma factor [Ignavibacteriota bacterium]
MYSANSIPSTADQSSPPGSYSIVANNCLMRRRTDRTKKNEISFEDEKLISDLEALAQTSAESSPMSTILEKELRSALDGAILKLPLDYRIVFVMRDIEGMSAAEVSKVLDISVPAIKSRLFRAREFLRIALEPYMEGQQ